MHVAIQSLILQTELSGRDGSVRLLLLWAPYDYSYLLILIAHMQYCLAWHQSRRACWLKETFPGSALAACDPLCPVFPSHWGYVGTLWEQLFKLLSFTLFPKVSIKSMPTFIDYVAYTFLAWFLRFVPLLWCSKYLLYPFIIHNNYS